MSDTQLHQSKCDSPGRASGSWFQYALLMLLLLLLCDNMNSIEFDLYRSMCAHQQKRGINPIKCDFVFKRTELALNYITKFSLL